MAGRRPLIRLVLLIAVAFGVAGMHTLGHAGMEHASFGHAAMPAISAPWAAPTGAGVHGGALAAMHDVVAGRGFSDAGEGRGSGPDVNPFSVCMAVLTALAMAVLVAAALQAARVRTTANRPAPPVASPSRAPPPVPLGLRIADLSVLRT